jgi:hypothetical protein
MRGSLPQLILTREQAARWQMCLQHYRCYALTALFPCPHRNSTLRILQAFQGKLISVKDQPMPLFQLLLTAEEMLTLRSITTELLKLYAQQPASAQRNALLADVAALQARLKHDG